MNITKGTTFNTDFEQGCIAQGEPDVDGSFDALDSDGVLCSYGVEMVQGHPDYISRITNPFTNPNTNTNK